MKCPTCNTRLPAGTLLLGVSHGTLKCLGCNNTHDVIEQGIGPYWIGSLLGLAAAAVAGALAIVGFPWWVQAVALIASTAVAVGIAMEKGVAVRPRGRG